MITLQKKIIWVLFLKHTKSICHENPLIPKLTDGIISSQND